MQKFDSFVQPDVLLTVPFILYPLGDKRSISDVSLKPFAE
jgi:hypothetical protein